MTKTQAMKIARKRIRLVRWVHGGWVVLIYDPGDDYTYQSEPLDYAHALEYRRAALLEEAREILGEAKPR